MYNDNNLQQDRRRAMMRPVCQMRPTLEGVNSSDAGGGRLCDGTMPNQNSGTNDRRMGFGLRNHPLAMVYSPYQEWRDAYTPEVALTRGTLFAELDLPFEGDKRKGGL